MIDEYSEEFKLNFVTNLRLQVKTRKLNEGKVELHGILFNGNLSLMSATQFIPEEVVEKIVDILSTLWLANTSNFGVK